WSPCTMWSPVRQRMLRTPNAAAPKRSLCSAIRFRSRHVTCMIGSTPSRASRAAAAHAAMWTIPAVLSGTFTASTWSRTSRALRLHPRAHHARDHLAATVHAHAAARSVAQRLRAAHGAGHAGFVQDALPAHLAAEDDFLARGFERPDGQLEGARQPGVPAEEAAHGGRNGDRHGCSPRAGRRDQEAPDDRKGFSPTRPPG